MADPLLFAYAGDEGCMPKDGQAALLLYPYVQPYFGKALTTPEVKQFILDKYKGAVIPAFK